MCGLYGYNGLEKPNEDKLKILAMYNLARGDDSCGVYWDGKVYKGTGTEANICKFLEKNILPSIEKHFTIIGHDRKSTYGSNIADNVHPFTYFLADQDENSLPYAVGAHNGTIKNKEEIRKKYNADVHAVDSCEILQTITNSKTSPDNIDVLEDYEGFGAFLWTYPKQNRLFIFRGKSGQGETETGERPLYYWKVQGGNAVYISSIKESLQVICDDDVKNIHEFEPNRIHTIYNGKISTFKRIFDRSKRNVIEPVTNNFPQHNQGARKSYNNSVKDASELFVNFPTSAITKYNKKEHTKDTEGRPLIDNEPCIDVAELVKLTGNKHLHNKITYYGGKYQKNGHILGGKLKMGEIIEIDEDGFPKHHKAHNSKTAKTYYFWNGWTCKDEASMNSLISNHKSRLLFDKPTDTEWDLKKITPYTTCIVFNTQKTGGWNYLGGLENTNKWSNDYVSCYSGQFVPLFNQGKTYHFQNGFLEKVVFNITTLFPKNLQDSLKEDGANTENAERELIEEALFETVNYVEEVRNDLSALDTDSGANEDKKIRIIRYLDESYKYLKAAWEHISNGGESPDEEEETEYKIIEQKDPLF